MMLGDPGVIKAELIGARNLARDPRVHVAVWIGFNFGVWMRCKKNAKFHGFLLSTELQIFRGLPSLRSYTGPTTGDQPLDLLGSRVMGEDQTAEIPVQFLADPQFARL
jgi:hypothetical protein